jgi:hypothetical protein
MNFETLDFGGKASLCWSFFWRGMLITIGSMLVGAILGGLAGFLIGMVGGRSAIGFAQWVGGALGILSGCVFLYLYIRWLLSSRLGRFRLVLVSAAD